MTIDFNFRDSLDCVSNPDVEEFLSQVVQETLDTELIHTYDIVRIWEDLNRPEPESFDSADTISGLMVAAICDYYAEGDGYMEVWDQLSDAITAMLVDYSERADHLTDIDLAVADTSADEFTDQISNALDLDPDTDAALSEFISIRDILAITE